MIKWGYTCTYIYLHHANMNVQKRTFSFIYCIKSYIGLSRVIYSNFIYVFSFSWTCICSFRSFEISEDILKNQKFMIGFSSFSNQRCIYLALIGY